MRELATIEAVEAAIKQIKSTGLEPTAARVLDHTRQQGTVLRQMRNLEARLKPRERLAERWVKLDAPDFGYAVVAT